MLVIRRPFCDNPPSAITRKEARMAILATSNIMRARLTSSG